MGNIIGSEQGLENLHFKMKASKGGNYTSQGRFSTPTTKHRSATDVRMKKVGSCNNFGVEEDLNTKIYKEIFPPPNKIRNTIAIHCKKGNSGKDIIRVDQPPKDFPCEEIKNSSVDMVLASDIFAETTAESESGKENNDKININYVNEFELKCVKTGEDIRRSYIAKLISKKVWQPTIKEKDHNTLIIFDWDDTLLCTSFLTPNGIFSDEMKIGEKDLDKIRKLDSCASAILKMAISKGETYIITNAAPGWVEYSAKRFYPEVAKSLNQVTIVSARGEYEKKYPGDSRQWKILAFLEMLKNLDTNLVTNLICLGDSVIEMEAAHILASKFSQAYIKTIKFREAPKPEELHKQLNLVIDQFDKIFCAVKNLTIRVEKKAKDKTFDKDK